MTKIAKLFASVRGDPHRIISFRGFERLLHACGFVHKRTVGSHRHYRHPKVPNVLTIVAGKEAKRYQLREFVAMAEEFDLRPEE